jgi:hypothetical protein
MSDGPHRSLNMRKGWKRVAESADNKAFSAAEVREAIVPALEEDCRGEIRSEFIQGLRRIGVKEEGSLFKSDTAPSLESLRNAAGAGSPRLRAQTRRERTISRDHSAESADGRAGGPRGTRHAASRRTLLPRIYHAARKPGARKNRRSHMRRGYRRPCA